MRTVNTDVVVLAIAEIDADELWVAIGTGASFKHISVHQFVSSNDPRICSNPPVFHALTWCDTVSSFSGRGMKTAWDTWLNFPEVTEMRLKPSCRCRVISMMLFCHYWSGLKYYCTSAQAIKQELMMSVNTCLPKNQEVRGYPTDSGSADTAYQTSQVPSKHLEPDLSCRPSASLPV